MIVKSRRAMRKEFVAHTILLVAAIALAACATLAPQSFSEKVGAGYQTVTAIADATTTLHQAGAISDQDAKNVLAQEELLKEGLDVSRTVHDTDPQGGDAKLAATLTALTALQAYLDSKKAVPK